MSNYHRILSRGRSVLVEHTVSRGGISTENGSLLGFVPAVIFVVFLLYLLRKTIPKYKIYIVFFSIPQVWAVISSAYIETGIYITEQERFSYYTGATPRLVVINFIFYASLFIFLNYRLIRHSVDDGLAENQIRYKDYKVPTKVILLLGIAASFIIVTYLYIQLAENGVVPLFSLGEVSRFNYWNEYNSDLLAGKIFSNIYPISFLLGSLFSSMKTALLPKSIRISPLIIFIALLVYLILLANKFTALYVSILAFIIPLFINNRLPHSVNKMRLIIFASSSLFLFLGLTYNQYSLVSDNPFQLILYRTFGLQGHMWWGIDNLLSNASIDHYGHFVNEIQEILSPTVLHVDSGMRFLMILLDPKVAWVYISNGVNLSMAYPAIAAYTFGYIGACFFQIAAALLVALFIRWNVRLIKQGRVISATIVFKLLFAVYYVFSMGDFRMLFSINNLAYMFLVILISIVQKTVSVNSRSMLRVGILRS